VTPALFVVQDWKTGATVAIPDMVAFIDRYARNGPHGQDGPEMLVREVFLAGMTGPLDPNQPNGPTKPAEPDEWQIELLRAYGRYDRRISVRSGHGPGKTACLAWIIDHHLITEFPQKTAITAPTKTQMWVALWPEISKWMRKAPDFVRDIFEFKSETIEHKGNADECFVRASVARPENPEALAGVHCDDGSVLLIADESSGVHEKIFESASGSMSGHNATTILAGNPVRTAGLFFDTHHKLKDIWTTFHINVEECARVSKDFVEDMRRRYGEASNAYGVRVRGDFPKQDKDQVIPFEHIEAAQIREVTPNPMAEVVWGCDPARKGGDRFSLVKRRKNVVLELPKVWVDKDLMQSSAIIYEEYLATPIVDRPVEILVDAIGMGAGIVDRLRMLDLPARGINVSESPALSDRYANLRAELYFRMKEWFGALDCAIPKDIYDTPNGSLGAELGLATFDFTKTMKVFIHTKEDIKRKNGGKSPDLSEALLMTFASTATSLLYGTSGSSSHAWNKPLKRGIKGVV